MEENRPLPPNGAKKTRYKDFYIDKDAIIYHWSRGAYYPRKPIYREGKMYVNIIRNDGRLGSASVAKLLAEAFLSLPNGYDPKKREFFAVKIDEDKPLSADNVKWVKPQPKGRTPYAQLQKRNIEDPDNHTAERMREIIKKSGLSNVEFSEIYGIPVRKIQIYLKNARVAPSHELDWLSFCVEHQMEYINFINHIPQ